MQRLILVHRLPAVDQFELVGESLLNQQVLLAGRTVGARIMAHRQVEVAADDDFPAAGDLFDPVEDSVDLAGIARAFERGMDAEDQKPIDVVSLPGRAAEFSAGDPAGVAGDANRRDVSARRKDGASPGATLNRPPRDATVSLWLQRGRQMLAVRIRLLNEQ